MTESLCAKMIVRTCSRFTLPLSVIYDLWCGCFWANKTYLQIDSTYEMCLANENKLTLTIQSHITKQTLHLFRTIYQANCRNHFNWIHRNLFYILHTLREWLLSHIWKLNARYPNLWNRNISQQYKICIDFETASAHSSWLHMLCRQFRKLYSADTMRNETMWLAF